MKRLLVAIIIIFPTLNAGYEKKSIWWKIEPKLQTKIRTLIGEVREGKKKPADLNKSMSSHKEIIPYEEIPLLLLVTEEDAESLSLMRQLLEMGADPNIKDSYGPKKSALKLATEFGSSKGVQLLLEHKANARENSHILYDLIDACGTDSENYTNQSFESRELEIRKNAALLVHYGADVNYSSHLADSPNTDHTTLLHQLIDEYSFYQATDETDRDEKEKTAFTTIRTLIDLFSYHGANPYKKLVSEGIQISAIDWAKEEGLSQLANHLTMRFRIHAIARLLCGTKQDTSLSYGPFPYNVAYLIAQHRFNYFESLT